MKSAFLLLALAASPAFAQTSTATDPNTAICAGLLAEAPGGVSGDHTKLCACLTRETPKQLTQADMLAYAQASAESKAPPNDVMNKVMAIATQCLQEAQ